jgi:hypothetical protein
MEEFRQDLRAITKKCRPDWDITTPELKAAWQKDRKELFYPYGKNVRPNFSVNRIISGIAISSALRMLHALSFRFSMTWLWRHLGRARRRR